MNLLTKQEEVICHLRAALEAAEREQYEKQEREGPHRNDSGFVHARR